MYGRRAEEDEEDDGDDGDEDDESKQGGAGSWQRAGFRVLPKLAPVPTHPCLKWHRDSVHARMLMNASPIFLA